MQKKRDLLSKHERFGREAGLFQPLGWDLRHHPGGFQILGPGPSHPTDPPGAPACRRQDVGMLGFPGRMSQPLR